MRLKRPTEYASYTFRNSHAETDATSSTAGTPSRSLSPADGRLEVVSVSPLANSSRNDVREVFLDADDRQFVIDGEGDRVYNVWILADEPVGVGGEGVRS
jgi:hypothetical protein